MAANTRIDDPQGQADDWIEVENMADASADIAGPYLTDDLSEPTKWQMPADLGHQTALPPSGFAVIWADPFTPFDLSAFSDAQHTGTISWRTMGSMPPATVQTSRSPWNWWVAWVGRPR